MQDLRESADIRLEKSEEKHREEALGRSQEAGKVVNGKRPSCREQSSLTARVEVEMEIESD